jgi:acetyltransferase-like isoleucine patch superfamily enzyme
MKLRRVYDQKIGLRTAYKTLKLYSKAKNHSPDRKIQDYLLNGNTEIRLEKNSKIINKGTINMGLSKNPHVSTKQACILQMGENSTLIINGRFNAEMGAVIVLSKGATLEIGANVNVSFNSKLLCYNNIKIGNDTVISWDVQILDSDLHKIKTEGFVISKPVQIGNHVLIMSRATILKGVKIGDSAIVAAGSMVTQNIPEKCLVAGVPAKVVKENVEWSTPLYGEFT